MTSLRFVGDLPLWAGLILALIFSGMSWNYYRRESFDLPRRLRWMLPLLRSMVFFLAIIVLTQPVLHHRKVIGELGHVRIFVDTSQSMGLRDQHLSAGRKLLIAEERHWIPEGRLDSRALKIAEALSEAQDRTTVELRKESLTADDVVRMRDRLTAPLKTLSDLPPATGPAPDISSAAPPTSADTRDAEQLVATLNEIAVSSEPSAVAAAAGQLAAVCEAIPPLEQQLRSSFEAEARRLIDSGDESIQAAIAMFDETSRLRRAEQLLLDGPAALLSALRKNHDVELFSLHNQDVMKLPDEFATARQTASLFPIPDGATTDLASGLANSHSGSEIPVAQGPDSETETSRIDSDVSETRDDLDASATAAMTTPKTAVILFSDGRHNFGPSPQQTARILGSQNVAIYPVSLGADRAALDIAVTGLEHPQMVFEKDRVRGTLLFRDKMPAGQPLVAQIEWQTKVLWQKSLLTENSGDRRVEFEFEFSEIADQFTSSSSADVKQYAVPMTMTASITPLTGEAESENNQQTMRLAAITQNNRLLILDGRPRWETRYLRNAFERDSKWDVNVVLAGPGTESETLPRGTTSGQFPESRENLFDYDLIIFGEVAASIFADHELTWIREFVETRGGGLVLIDGRREELRRLPAQSLLPLVPIEWLPPQVAALPTKLQLTESGQREQALTLDTEPSGNRRFWNELPVPHSLCRVSALPGSEVLVEAVVDGSVLPAIVTRRSGAGRVLYLAFDETWRWRYKAADTYHQRIWNQLARFVMPRPFAASDEYLAVDSGPVSYRNQESADLRIRLRGLDGKPTSDATADALLWKEGRVVSTVGLTPDPDQPGIYRGKTEALSEGEYQVSVRASGFSDDVLKARGEFVVLPAESGELDDTACNELLLKQMAAESGGTYLREEQIGQLPKLLSPLSRGRVVESDTLLWQTYWWFSAIVLLLTLEWFLRKRAGLL